MISTLNKVYPEGGQIPPLAPPSVKHKYDVIMNSKNCRFCWVKLMIYIDLKRGLVNWWQVNLQEIRHAYMFKNFRCKIQGGDEPVIW